MTQLLEESSSQLTSWGAEVSTLRSTNTELSESLQAEACQSSHLRDELGTTRDDLQSAIELVSSLRTELADLAREKDLVSEVTIRFKAEADANEAAFGRLKEQLAAYAQRIDALQVCATTVCPCWYCSLGRSRALR